MHPKRKLAVRELLLNAVVIDFVRMCNSLLEGGEKDNFNQHFHVSFFIV